jgi:hypothetical protein
MTSLTSQGGKLVVHGNALGTGQECCCDEETGACCSPVIGCTTFATGQAETAEERDRDVANFEAFNAAAVAALEACGWTCVTPLEVYSIPNEEGFLVGGAGWCATCAGEVDEENVDTMCCVDYEQQGVFFEEVGQETFTATLCVWKCNQSPNLKPWATFGPEAAAGGTVSPVCNEGLTRQECESRDTREEDVSPLSKQCGGVFHPGKECPNDPVTFCGCADTWTLELGCDEEENPAP